MSEAESLLIDNQPERRLFWQRLQAIGFAVFAFFLSFQLFTIEDDEEYVLEALNEDADLFLDVEPDDFEILLASENIEELDDFEEVN